MLFRKIVAVCIENHKNIIKALCQQNSMFLNIMVQLYFYYNYETYTVILCILILYCSIFAIVL
jgi:hypothetical protein